MTELLTIPPMPERHLSDRLDFYKLTMAQLALTHYPDAEITFTLKNRSSDPLSRYIDPVKLIDSINTIAEQGFTSEEIDYYRSLTATDGSPRFNDTFLDYLADPNIPKAESWLDPATGDITVRATSAGPSASWLETVVMTEIGEQHFKGMIETENLSLQAIYEEGDRRLSEKIARLKERPDIKFADFGTRRRFSAEWHSYVIGRLAKELPDNFIGTSNPWFAQQYGIPPIGTYAHEAPMIYAALEDAATGRPLDGHTKMLADWQEYYGKDLSIALTDTFTSEFFFEDFGEHGAKTWKGLRHDSGDPYEFGERAIAFYKQHGVDPNDRTIVFSDGLDIDEIIRLADHFAGRIQLLFGWGTTLMNDMGVKPLNIVMKATKVNSLSTVKLGDDKGKQTGAPEVVERYQRDVKRFLGQAPAKQMVTL